jgi:hypothetical protein
MWSAAALEPALPERITTASIAWAGHNPWTIRVRTERPEIT